MVSLRILCRNPGLAREEAFEDTLRLPFRRVLEVDPDVHAPRATQSRVQALDVIRGRKEYPALGGCDAIETVQQATQTQGGSVAVAARRRRCLGR